MKKNLQTIIIIIFTFLLGLFLFKMFFPEQVQFPVELVNTLKNLAIFCFVIYAILCFVKIDFFRVYDEDDDSNEDQEE